jgi:iron(III) transport system permease protein
MTQAALIVRSPRLLDRSPGRLAAPILVLTLLLPLLSGLSLCVLPGGREALAYWYRDARGWSILARSFAFAAAGATAAIVAGGAIALSLPRSQSLSRLILLATCLPLLVPSSLMGAAWIMSFGRDAVATNVLRLVLGAHTPTIYDWPFAAAATGLRYLAVPALILAAANRHPRAIQPAEHVFGFGWRVRLRLRFSALRAPAMASWLLLLLLVQSDHILPTLFLVPTFGTQILIQYNALMDSAGAAALALPPTLAALAIAFCIAWLLEKTTWTQAASEPGVEHHRALKLVIAITLIALTVAIPMIGIVIRSRSLANLVDILGQAKAELIHSLFLAAAGSALTLLFPIPLASIYLRSRAGSWIPLVLVNLAVPGSLLALGLVQLCDFACLRSLRDSELPLLFAYAARFTPIAIIVLVAGWLRLPESDHLAARIHRVPIVHRITRITVPTRLAATMTTAALVALLVFAELEISLILVRPGPTTLGVRLYTLIHTAPDHIVAGLATDLLGIVLGFGLLLFIVACAVGRIRR